MTEKRARVRYAAIVLLLGAALVALVARLTVLHLGRSDAAREEAERVRRVHKTIAVGRGRILDGSAAANILALDVGVKDVCVDPSVMLATTGGPSAVATLARHLAQAPDALEDRLRRAPRHFACVAPQLDDALARRIEALRLPGVFLRDARTRCYPQGTRLCHVLGFVSADGTGSAGIEQAADRYLRGAPGHLESELDGRRREMYVRRIHSIPPREGADVVLTIDQNLQYFVEQALDAAVAAHHAHGAWAIIERVRTGEILALASRPAFDPNAFRPTSDAQRLNRAIGWAYEPGSTFKVAIIAAALNEGLVTPETVFDCENGQWLYLNRVLRDYHPYGLLSVADVIKKSSNIGAAKIALRLGDARLEQYLRGFGIGRRLGIDLPGEEAGILHPAARWSAISASRLAIGQGLAVTALQMLGVMCAIANDGVLMRPYVIRRIVPAHNGAVVETRPQRLAAAVTPATAATLRMLLGRVTEAEGTGIRARIPGVAVAGKTGTAQKPVDGSYSDTAYTASFVGFLPAEAPEVGIIVVVDEPQPLHTGGAVAAPVFAAIAEPTMRYLGGRPADGAIAAR